MIQLTKTATATPDVYSDGSGTAPITVTLTLDGTGTPASITGATVSPVYVWADNTGGDIATYSDIALGLSGSNAGVTWELSANGSTGWGATLALSNLNVASGYQTTQVYVRASALNDGSVLTGNYTATKVTLSGTSNPPA